MHDIGRLGLLLYDARKYQAALLQKFIDLHEATTVEKTLVGMTHCEAGETLGETWHLPESLQKCIASHHDECDSSSSEVNLVRIACGLADFLGFPEVEREDVNMAPRLPEGIKDRPELRPERLREQVTTAIATFGW
jgi:HD-like signal output (HDOD) protein